MALRRPNLLDAFRRVPIAPPASPASGAGTTPSRAPNPATTKAGVTPPTTAQPTAPAPQTPVAKVPTPARTASSSIGSAPIPVSPKPVAPQLAPVRPTPVAPPARVQPAPAPQRIVEHSTESSEAAAVAEALAPHEPALAPPALAPNEPASAPALRANAPAVTLRAPSRERIVLLALALAVAILVLVLLLRRDGGIGAETGVQAANPTPTATPTATPTPGTNASATPTAAAHAGTSLPGVDAALHDPANRFTVRLVQYPDDAKGLAFATDAYRWLIKEGYPVGSPIRLATGRGIVLCADAKPTSVDLVPMRDNLRGVRYPTSSKTMPFSDAYIDEIDHVLAR